MRKSERKETANKGFSLVELIVVVAIMAVLMVVLAPALLKYVEKTRLQKDNSAISEIANAIEIACANEKVISNIPAAGVTFTATTDGDNNQVFTFDAGATGDGSVLQKELNETIGATVVTNSTNYRNAAEASNMLSIKVTATTSGVVTVEVSNWIAEPDAGVSTQKF